MEALHQLGTFQAWLDDGQVGSIAGKSCALEEASKRLHRRKCREENRRVRSPELTSCPLSRAPCRARTRGGEARESLRESGLL
jgi:hypothetical protein